jgi:hypothetical protein
MKENMVERHPEKLFETRRSSRHGCFYYLRKAKSISGQILKWIMELSASKYN